MIMHETYVSSETARLLKQAGFDWECKAHYKQNGDFILRGYDFDWNATASVNPNVEYYSAPTLDVAQRWLREVKHIYVDVFPTDNNFKSWNCCPYSNFDIDFSEWDNFSTYEEALEWGIKNCIELILK